MLKKMLAAFVLILAAPAAGQERASDPAAVAAAREMLVAGDFEEQLEAVTHQMAEATVTTMLAEFEAQHGVEYPPALEQELRTLLREHNEAILTAIRPTALDDAARIYARYFTAEEIRELHRLQTHPVMVKFQRIGPQFMAEMSQIGVAESARHLPELQQRIAEALANWRRRNQIPAVAPST